MQRKKDKADRWNVEVKATLKDKEDKISSIRSFLERGDDIALVQLFSFIVYHSVCSCVTTNYIEPIKIQFLASQYAHT